MNVKKILMFAVGAVVMTAIGLAILNRAKAKLPVIATIIG